MEASFPWLSFYEEGVPSTLHYPDAPLTSLLLEAAAAHGDRPAIRFFGKTLSYQELLQRTYQFANALTGLGVQSGERVAIMLPNLPQYVIAYYGTLFAGAIVVQTNPLYVERELTEHLCDAGAVAIVCLDLSLERVLRVRDDTALRTIMVTRVQDELPLVKKWFYPLLFRKSLRRKRSERESNGVERFQDLLAAARATPPEGPPPACEDVAVLQYTGGTTGTPKGAMLTHRNLLANVRQCQAWMLRNKPAEEIILTAVPLFHVYGMTVCMNYAVAMAASLVLVPRFEAAALLKLIERERPTLFPGAPTMYIGLLHHPRLLRFDLSSIRICISGSAALPLHVKLAFEKRIGGKLVEGYGLSEASPVTHVNPIWGRTVNGSIGLPWPDTIARIVEPDGEAELASGEIGELEVKGPQVMKGYWKRSEETAEVLRDGWLRTGDLAFRDEAGYFYIVDRKKDMINASGLKIYPREVEEVLFRHPSVREAAVIGVPDGYRGETVKAFVVPEDGQIADPDELTRFCREHLAPYKVPRQIEFRSELPKSIVGKPLRRVLAEASRHSSAKPANPADPANPVDPEPRG